MAAVFSKTTKLMLKNVIRHTKSHNKTVEESEMWQQFERTRGMNGLDPSNPSYGHDDRCQVDNGRDRRGDYWNSKSEKSHFLSTTQGYKQAHMDEEKGGKRVESSSTYWMRQLEKLESSDPNRWDHSGYRELYPKDFNSERSHSSSPAPTDRHKKFGTKQKKAKKKKKRQHSESSKHRSKGDKSSQKRKKQSTRHHSDTSDSSDTESSPARRHRHKAKKKSKKRERKKHRSESSDKKKRVGKDEQENKLVIEMWKEANGHVGSSKRKDFDRRLEKEISSQYHNLKRKYVEGESEGNRRKGREQSSQSESESEGYSHKRKRRKHSTSESSSDSD